MDSSLEPDGSLLGQFLWSTDPAVQATPGWVFVVALFAVAFVYGPLLVRTVRLLLLERAVRDASRLDDRAAELHRSEIATAFSRSPLASQWEEFDYRWRGSLAEGDRLRAPIRLLDILDERPLVPTGPTKSLLPALPGIFLAVGVTGTFVGLGAALEAGAGGPAAVGELVGASLGSALWGLFLAIAALIAGRLFEGTFDRLAENLDLLVERAFGAVSSGEMTSLSARTQRDSLLSLGAELHRFTSDLTERIDRGLQRIEHSTASAAALVSEEQRNVLQNVVNELSVQVQTGVAEHLSALHDVLGRAVDHQGAVTGGLTEAFEHMAANAQVHARVTQVLEQAALSVRDAAGSMSDTAGDLTPVLDHLRLTGAALSDTAATMRTTQETVARNAEGIRLSIEQATAAMFEQREFIESGLAEIRTTIGLMSTGLGENLDRALRNVDDALDHTIGRLQETIESSNETIDRMSVPVRAAEGTSRELHTALERVRGEIAGLGEWLGQAVKPLRGTLTQLEERAADISRALTQFGDRAQHVDKTVEALRGEIQDEGRRLRSSTGELARQLQSVADAAIGLTGIEPRASRAEPATSPAPTAAPGASAHRLDELDPAPPSTRPTPPAPTRTAARPASSAPRSDPSTTAAPSGPSNDEDPATSKDGAHPAATSPSPRSEGWTRVPRRAASGAGGPALGRDPYARTGESQTLLERQRRILGGDPGRSKPSIDDLSADHPDDEPKLSGLLSKREPGPGSSTAKRPVGEDARSNPEAAGSTEVSSDDDASDRDRPRTWQLLGRD